MLVKWNASSNLEGILSRSLGFSLGTPGIVSIQIVSAMWQEKMRNKVKIRFCKLLYATAISDGYFLPARDRTRLNVLKYYRN